jgi:hypothetical protein
VHPVLAGEPQVEDLSGVHRRLAVTHAPVAVLALAAALAQLGVEAVERGRVQAANRDLAERREIFWSI